MAKQKLPVDWRDRPLDKWTVSQFHAYLSDRHFELYEITYVPMRGWMAEKGMLKRSIDELGREVLRDFIDDCFRDYRPTTDYPSINAGFMLTYMKSRILPPILAEKARKERLASVETPTISVEEINDWL